MCKPSLCTSPAIKYTRLLLAARSPDGVDGKSPGLHYVGEMGDEKGMMRKIFDHATGGKVEWQQMSDVYDRAVFRTQEEQRNMTAEVMWRCLKSVCLARHHSFPQPAYHQRDCRSLGPTEEEATAGF